MDLLTGLTAISQAIGIAKELKEIDRGVDEATFKLKLADLQLALADSKVALADAKVAQAENEEKISELEAQLDTALNGDTCPKCGIGRLRFDGTSTPRGGLSDFGVEKRHYRCEQTGCEYEMTKLHDPHGAVPKAAAKSGRR